MEKKFIKVTPKGAKKSVIVPAANEAFYRSQHATIETPTDEEIEVARPEVRAQHKVAQLIQAKTAEADALRKECEALKAKIAALEAKDSGKGK